MLLLLDMHKKMYKNPKKSLSTKFRTVIGVFSILGISIVGLGVLFVTNSLTQAETSLESQAYSGYVVQNPGLQKQTGGGKFARLNPITRPPAEPPQTQTSPTQPGSGQPTNPGSGAAPDPGSGTGTPTAPENPKPIIELELSSNPKPVVELQLPSENQAARPTQSTHPGDTIPFVGETIPFVGETMTQTGGTPGTPTNPTQPSTGTTPSNPTTPSQPSSGTSGSTSGSSNNNDDDDNSSSGSQASATSGDAYAEMICSNYILTQLFFRNNVAYTRGVPINADGRPQWASAEGMREVINLNQTPNILPGSGPIMAYDAYVNPGTSTFIQTVSRGNKLFIKSVPTKFGLINWTEEAKYPWVEVQNDLPNNAVNNAYATSPIIEFRGGDKTLPRVWMDRTIYSGLVGYRNSTYSQVFKQIHPQDYRQVVDLAASSKGQLAKVVDLATNQRLLPGEGPIQAVSDYVNPQGTILHQSWYRDNIGYTRDVPIANGRPDFANAKVIIHAVNLQAKTDKNPNGNPSALPGTGEIQAAANFISCRPY